MKILVCGHTGFMGKNIYNTFNSLLNVFGASKSHAHIGYGAELTFDLTNQLEVNKLIRDLKPDVVIQAAATTSGAKDIVNQPYIHVTDNAVMNSLILRACFEHKVKHFIFLSCGVMYQSGDIPRKETDFNLSDELYKSYFGVGWTKIYIEQMCKFYSRLGLKTTVIRHTNTYGPHDKYDPDHSHVFGATVRKVMNPINNEVVIWGKGEEARDLIYVSDVVDAIKLLIEKQTDMFELVNVSYGSAITINDLVALIIKQTGKPLSVFHDTSAPNIPFKLTLDHSYITEKYGWTPKVSIEDGIKYTLNWYKEHYMNK